MDFSNDNPFASVKGFLGIGQWRLQGHMIGEANTDIKKMRTKRQLDN